MKVYKNTQALEAPKEIEIMPLRVFISENIVFHSADPENEESVDYYTFDLYEYTKDEYASLMEERTEMLEDALQQLIIDMEG